MKIEKNEGKIGIEFAYSSARLLTRRPHPFIDFQRRGQTFQSFRRHLAAIQNTVCDGYRHLVLIQTHSPITDAKIGKLFHDWTSG